MCQYYCLCDALEQEQRRDTNIINNYNASSDRAVFSALFSFVFKHVLNAEARASILFYLLS